MNNKHIFKKERPITHIGLVVSQELCWSHTCGVPSVTFPRQAEAHMTGDGISKACEFVTPLNEVGLRSLAARELP